MKNSNSSLLLILLPLAAIAGAAGSYLMGPEPPEAQPAAATPGVSDDLVARLDALEEENLDLRRRLGDLELRPEPATRQPVDRTAEEERLASIEARLDALESPDSTIARTAQRREADLEFFKDAIEQDARVKREEGQRRKAESRARNELARWTKDLGLDEPQQEAFQAALDRRYEGGQQLRNDWEAGVLTMEQAGEAKATIFEDFHTELEGFLSPSQLEQFDTAQAQQGGK